MLSPLFQNDFFPLEGKVSICYPRTLYVHFSSSACFSFSPIFPHPPCKQNEMQPSHVLLYESILWDYPFRRPDSSFMWFLNPLKSIRYIIWHNHKWTIIKILALVFLRYSCVLYEYSSNYLVFNVSLHFSPICEICEIVV